MISARYRLAALLTCALLLSSCGFRLAGTSELPEQIGRMQLTATDFSKTQEKALRRTLNRAGAELVDQADATAVQLVVRLEAPPDQQLVTSASSGEIVKRVSRGLNFSVKAAGGNTLVAPRSLRQQKDVVLDDNNLASSEREKKAVERDLEQALYDQLVRQLSRIE